MNCLICTNEITRESETDEHILPNSIGGKLVSKKLICKDCNSTFGEKCDASLARDFNLFCNFLDIKRDRGKSQNLAGATSTKTYRIKPGGKPVLGRPFINIQDENGSKTIRIEAKGEKELKQVLNGLKRSYPSINVDDLIEQAEQKREYLNESIKLKFQIGSIDTYRALMKISYFLLKYKMPEITIDDRNIISFLKGEIGYDYISFYYPENDLFINSEDTINHVIVIKSYPDENILVSYVELFNTVSFVLILAEYFSEDIQISYVYDVLSRKEIENPTLNIPKINKTSLFELFESKSLDKDRFKNKLDLFISKSLSRQNRKHLDDLTNRAIDNTFKNIPEGATFTKEMLNHLIRSFENEITPFFVRNLRDLGNIDSSEK